MRALAIFFIKVSNGYQKHGRDCIDRGGRGPIGTEREGRTEPDGGVHA